MALFGIKRSALLSLLGGLVLTVWAGQWAAGIAESEARLAFDKAATGRFLQLKERLDAYEGVLRGLQGFFAGSTEVDRDEFRAYVHRLDLETRLPGVQVIGFARAVSLAGRDSYVDAVRSDRRLVADGYPEFSIRPPGERPEYLVIEYTEPAVGNEAAFGFDLFSEGARRSAAERARATGAPAATAPVTLVQETAHQASFLLILPIYRNGAALTTIEQRRDSFVGVVFAAFRMEDLARGVFGQDADSFDLTVVDLGQTGSAGADARPLLHLEPPGTSPSLSAYAREKQLAFGGRQWRLRTEALETPTAVKRTAVTVLAGGALISFLVFALLQSFAGSRARALTLADGMTRELRESEARTRAVLDHTLDAIITIDEQGLIESFNLAAERLFGYGAGEVLGRNVKMLMPEPYAAEHDGYLAAYRQTAVRKIIGIGREVVGKRAGGSCFPMDLAVTEVAVNDRRRFIGLVRDITERKLAEERLLEANQRFDLAAESAGFGVWDWDIVANTLVWDDRMYALYGVRREDFSGAYAVWESAVHPEDRGGAVAALQAAVRGETPFDIEFRVRVSTRYGDEVRHIKGNGLVLRDAQGQAQRMIGINYDISERKKIEQLKTEFVSTVSHELRTPLTSIRGSLGLLEGGVAGELPAAAKSLINIAANNCERLVALINDILDMEKIASGRMSFALETRPLLPLVEQAVEANRGFAVQHQVRLEIVSPLADATARVDPDRFLQVLANLLSNAAKFSPPGETVGVSLLRSGPRLRIEVVDHGPGIPDEFRARIFEKFSQADGSTTRAKGGSGLGLSISRALVERMGGEIGFSSVAGEGSCFWFELPEVVLELATVPRAAMAAVVPGEAPRVLVCEDDPDIAQLLATLLMQAGYRVDRAPSAAAARRMLAAHAYAAMTLDIGLPDENGMDFLGGLRASEAGFDLPVVIVSGSADPATPALGGALAIADWLGKPIDAPRLVAAVTRAVHRRAAQRPRILHGEDDADLARIVAAQFGGLAEIVEAPTLSTAKDALSQGIFDVVILDLGLPDGPGLNLLPVIQGLVHPPQVVVFSASDPEASLERRQAVVASLVKSRTSNERLVQLVRELTQHAFEDETQPASAKTGREIDDER
ncbi:CHASE domain-containing protein [Accumulibacter sp.]|uniref:CHASE domain-containing protein n=1 Tax=Accumulibacter sp. TaxID=2053492 RepID=UPI00261E72A1|nr:CHASE domain-containing protein [Accumulibacter sp.]